jgi:hypothetical protein
MCAVFNFGRLADEVLQYGGSPVKVGDEEYSLFRDHEYDLPYQRLLFFTDTQPSILAKINE